MDGGAGYTGYLEIEVSMIATFSPVLFVCCFQTTKHLVTVQRALKTENIINKASYYFRFLQ